MKVGTKYSDSPTRTANKKKTIKKTDRVEVAEIKTWRFLAAGSTGMAAEKKISFDFAFSGGVRPFVLRFIWAKHVINWI